MVQDVTDQRVDGLVRAQDGLHLAQFLFAFLYDIGVRILSHQVVFLIDQAQGSLIQLQVDDAALVVDRAGGPVLYRLGHIVNVDIIAKYFPGAAVFRGNRSAGKPNVCSIGQAVPDDAGSADGGVDLQLALLVLPGDHLLRQAVLSPVGLVRHDYDVAPLRQGFAGLLKFLHGGEDDTVGLPAR